jgi:hypothetical protein
MTGVHDSVIGVKKEIILNKFVNGVNKRFEPARGRALLSAVFAEIDEKTGKARSLSRIIRG